MTYLTHHLSKMKNQVYLIIFFCSLAANATAITSQCHPKETIIFTCNSGQKSMSICSSPQDAAVQYVEYRYAIGSKKPSFTYRSDGNHSTKTFNRASVVGASSESIIIWFENFAYTYIVNDPIKGQPSISVWKYGQQIAENLCTGNYGGDSESPNQLIRDRSSEDYFNILRKKNK
jgi:hypothetical protein